MKGMRCVSSAVLVMSLALLCLGGPAKAQVAHREVAPPEPTSDAVELEAFRADLARYIQGMKTVADAAGLPSALHSASRSGRSWAV